MNSLVRLAAIACFTLAAACAPLPSYEELETEAETSGDWSLVERYERMAALKESRRPPSCPSGRMLMCEELLGSERCVCSSKESLRVYSPSR